MGASRAERFEPDLRSCSQRGLRVHGTGRPHPAAEMHSGEKRIGKSEAKMGDTERYELDLVRVDLKLILGKPENSFHEIVGDGARDGWRLSRTIVASTAGCHEAACLQHLFDRPVVKCLP